MKLGALGAKLFATKAAAVKTAVMVTGALVMEAGVVTTYKIVNDGPNIALAADQIEDTSTQSSGVLASGSSHDIVDTPDIYIPGRQQERSTYLPPK